MDKSPEAFRTISEVAETLDTPAHVLRFWESRFPQIKPVKRAGGRRYYRPNDVALLSGIRRLLHDDGLTIRGVQKILREQGVRYVAALSGAAPEPEDTEEALNIFAPPAPPPAGAEVIALRDWAPAVAEAALDALDPAAAGPDTDAPPLPDLPRHDAEPDAEDDEMRRPRFQPLIEDPQQPSLFDLPPEDGEDAVLELEPLPADAADAAAPMLEAPPSELAPPEDAAVSTEPAPATPLEAAALPDPASSEPIATQDETAPSEPDLAHPATPDEPALPDTASPEPVAATDEAPAEPVPAHPAADKPALPEAAPDAEPAEADSPQPDPCDLPWLPTLLRALPRDQAAARAGTLAAFLPRLEALHERMAPTRRRPG